MQKQYGDIVNKENIYSISKRDVKFIFTNEEKKHRDAYVLYVIGQWYVSSPKDSTAYKTLRSLIRKFNIRLTRLEKSELFVIEERMFSVDRHIKVLDVNDNLDKREQVGVKFKNSDLFIKNSSLKHITNGELLVSNKRIMINGNEPLDFLWTKIQAIHFEDYGFVFEFDSTTYVLRIHDQETLNNTLQNFINKKVNKWKA